MKLEQEIKQRSFQNEHQKLMVNILFTNGWLGTKIHTLLKPYGLSSQQYNILRILRGQKKNPVTITLLQDRMLDKLSNASRLVEKLRLKGMVERTQSSNDRRRVDVVITKTGLDTLKKIDRKMLNFEGNLKAIGPEEAKQLNDLLDKLRG